VADVEDDKIVFRAVDSPTDAPPVELAGSSGDPGEGGKRPE
jgi:hypothetical protein